MRGVREKSGKDGKERKLKTEEGDRKTQRKNTGTENKTLRLREEEKVRGRDRYRERDKEVNRKRERKMKIEKKFFVTARGAAKLNF